MRYRSSGYIDTTGCFNVVVGVILLLSINFILSCDQKIQRKQPMPNTFINRPLKMTEFDFVNNFKPCMQKSKPFEWTTSSPSTSETILGVNIHDFVFSVRGAYQSVTFDWRLDRRNDLFEAISKNVQQAHPAHHVIDNKNRDGNERRWGDPGLIGTAPVTLEDADDPCDPGRLIIPAAPNRFKIRFNGLGEAYYSHNEHYATLTVTATDASGAQVSKTVSILLAKPIQWCDGQSELLISHPYKEKRFTYSAKYGLGSVSYNVSFR